MAIRAGEKKNDFGKGPVWKCVLAQAVPLMIAQLVHLLYNIVDRIFIGHMEGVGTMALTGVGLTFPIVTLIMAFTVLFGNGGVPLFSIERGARNQKKAAKIQGNSLSLLLICSVILMICFYLFCRPILFAFGASEDSYVYARSYLNIYLAGTVFSMTATGMNGYISAQGFPKTGMLSITIGAAVNIVLDPVFIFALGMGVAGAALATVISQIVSALWVLRFLFGKRAIVPLSVDDMVLKKEIAVSITKLGMSNFIVHGTNCIVQVACNSTLQLYGGDLYVGIMTVTNSIREIFMLPISGLGSGAQPVISYNYGAKKYDRVRQGINFNTLASMGFTVVAWLLIFCLPKVWFGIFTDDASMVEIGTAMLRIYFFGFVCMALQFSGQTAFQALGDVRHAITFSLLRKVIIVVPLTFLLPMAGFGVKGVFLAEPVSNVIGGLACFITMRLTVMRRITCLEGRQNVG